MIECEIQAIKIGNSIGFTVPKEVAKNAHLKVGKKTKVLFMEDVKDKTWDELFGSLKSKFSVEELNRFTNEGEDLR